jgi:hypothetical protein
MKRTCCQCSRVVFDIPRGSEGRFFCDNDFCLEEYQKVQQGVYRISKYDVPDFIPTYSATTRWESRVFAL